MKKIFLFILAYIVTVSISAKTVYVSSTGSDANEGTTETAAVKTMSMALSIAQKNDIIKVLDIINLEDEPSKEESSRGNINTNGTSEYVIDDITYNTWIPIVQNGGRKGKVGLMMLNKNLTIEGTDTETSGIDGNNLSTLFRVDGTSNITFRNLTFKGGNNEPYGDSGAGFYIRSAQGITFENCVFTENKSTLNDNGGALNIIAADVTFTSCIFSDNYNANGSAVSAQGGTIIFDECLFTDHNAIGSNSKGTVYFSGMGNRNNLIVRSSVFRNNKMKSGGGAIFIQDGNRNINMAVTIEACAFIDNYTDFNGGAVMVNNNMTASGDQAASLIDMVVVNSTFYGNSLGFAEGSGLYVPAGNAGSKINVTNCTFTQNKSPNNNSGALRFLAAAENMEIGIFNCILEENQAKNNYMDATWQTTDDKNAAKNLSIKNTYIGATEANISETLFPGNSINYLTTLLDDSNFADYNAEKHYIPLSTASAAATFGDAKYLRDDLELITDQLGQIRTFTNDKCAIGAVETSVKPGGYADTYQHFFLYGQSHSAGAGSYPALSTESLSGNYMIGPNVWAYQQVPISQRTDFQSMYAYDIPANEGTTAFHRLGENPVVGLVNHIQKATEGTEAESRLLATSCGVGGQIIEQLNKDSELANHYNNYFLGALNKAQSIAKPKKIKMTCPAIFWMQGESNSSLPGEGQPARATTTDDYKALLIELKNDMQNDIMSVYKEQEEKPVFITYQMSGMFTGSLRDLPIARAHVELGNEEDDIICAGPMYPVTHHTVNDTHLDANGYRWYGEMFGKVYYKTQVLGEEFKPLQPIAYYTTDNSREVKVQFHVPVPPLVFDDKTLEKIPNYGFEVYLNGNSSRETIIGERIEGDCVILTLNKDIPKTGNIEIIYAGNSWGYKFGNLRDSDPYQAFYTYQNLDKKDDEGNYIYERENGTDGNPVSISPAFEPKDENGDVIYDKPYPLYNFCVAFYEKLDIAKLDNGTVALQAAVKESDKVIQRIELFSTDGTLVQTVNGADATYNLNSLPNGVYLVKITTDKGVITTKVIK